MDRSRPSPSRLFPLLLAALFAPCSSMHAQVDTTSTKPSAEIGYVPRLNLIKVGLTSTAAKAISLMYERVLSPDLSVAMTVSYMIPSEPSGFLGLGLDSLGVSNSRELKGYFLTPEVKWFLETSDKRPAPRGLYLGGYLRFSNINYNASMKITGASAENNGTIDGHVEVDLFEFGVGPSVGYQFLCAKDRLVIDALFFGPRYSMYRLNVNAQLAGDGALYDELSDALEEAIGRKIDSGLNIDLSTSGSTTIDRNSFGYRFGFKIGYAF